MPFHSCEPHTLAFLSARTPMRCCDAAVRQGRSSIGRQKGLLGAWRDDSPWNFEIVVHFYNLERKLTPAPTTISPSTATNLPPFPPHHDHPLHSHNSSRSNLRFAARSPRLFPTQTPPSPLPPKTMQSPPNMS